jgi:hypothetical protein
MRYWAAGPGVWGSAAPSSSTSRPHLFSGQAPREADRRQCLVPIRDLNDAIETRQMVRHDQPKGGSVADFRQPMAAARPPLHRVPASRRDRAAAKLAASCTTSP